MTFEEFKLDITKAYSKKKNKLRNSLGIYDIYKLIRKNKWNNISKPLTEKEFYSIIREVNLKIVEKLLEGFTIKLPVRMGNLEVHKYKTTIKIEEGKLKTNLKIDWNKTLKLWYDDEESKSNKTLVRIQSKYNYFINYDKSSANYNNKVFIDFIPCRDLKIKLKNAVNKGLDTIEYTKYGKLE